MLLGLSGDPNVMPWNRRAIGFELAPDRRVKRGRGTIHRKDRESLFQLLQPLLIRSPIARGQQTESVFPEGHGREQEGGRFGQRLGDANVSIKPSRQRIWYRPLLPLSGINLLELILDECLDLRPLTVQVVHGAVEFLPRFGSGSLLRCQPRCQ